MRTLALLGGLLVLGFTGCSTRHDECVSTCGGCCNDVGDCYTGTEKMFCGLKGNACQACSGACSSTGTCVAADGGTP